MSAPREQEHTKSTLPPKRRRTHISSVRPCSSTGVICSFRRFCALLENKNTRNPLSPSRGKTSNTSIAECLLHSVSGVCFPLRADIKRTGIVDNRSDRFILSGSLGVRCLSLLESIIPPVKYDGFGRANKNTRNLLFLSSKNAELDEIGVSFHYTRYRVCVRSLTLV